MLRSALPLFVAILSGCLSLTPPADAATPTAVIFCRNASAIEKLAAKEIRRYVYLRTGGLLLIVEELNAAAEGGYVIAVGKGAAQTLALSDESLQLGSLQPEQYRLKTIELENRPVLVVVGGDEFGTLYGAYRLAEHLGVRFYLHGDVVPDRQVPLEWPTLDEARRPLFNRRGIQPFHDFPEGPDWWDRDNYKAILGQLPKMGMNFFGLHTYPEGGVGPEPLVWIGLQEDVAADGKVRASYPARHFTTDSHPPAWGFVPGKTSDYVFGAAAMFDHDNYGADYMRGTFPWKTMSPDQCNALFDRMGDFLHDVFGYAHRLGIKTCLGTETPLTVPTVVKQRLQAAGKDPADPAVVQALYEGMFQRIARTHSLDYYWLWTPEGWTWSTVKQEQIDATVTDFRACLAAADKVGAPFTIATCGWVLGPPQAPALFDELLPKQVPMSCINRSVGNTPVEPGFARVKERPKWAIPWLEDDPGMTIPQLWVGRMRKDAADALNYGCTGLLGIHWRTRILGPNVSALAKAAWDQSGWTDETNEAAGRPLERTINGGGPADGDREADLPTTASSGPSRFLPVADFYRDWAKTQFGAEVVEPIAALFTRLDGHLPRPADWVTGPGSIRPDPRPWSQVQTEYAFVDELDAMRSQIAGPGNLERFDYWLNNFRYLRAIAKVNCCWARYNEARDKVAAGADPQAQKRLARELALPLRVELVRAFAELHQYLLATVTTAGEMGNVSNWQQQTMPVLLTAPGQELTKWFGEDLPPEAIPSPDYSGEPRLFVPAVRTGIVAGEPLTLSVIILGMKPQTAELCLRPLGSGAFFCVPLTHVARGVYTVTLPAESIECDFEYYVQATGGDSSLVFPPTAPAMNQTVVVSE